MKTRKSGIEYEVGSGNVFADLGLPEADDLLVKFESPRPECRDYRSTTAQIEEARADSRKSSLI